VCAPTAHVPGEVTAYQLIDGQQRLTTLALMLCAIRDLARDTGDLDLAEEISEDFLLHKRLQGLSRFKVIPRLGDREALLSILDSKDISSWRDFRVAKCLRFFVKEFGIRNADAPAPVLRRLLGDVTARMALVVVTVVGENPYEIFDSLNSTGLPLEQSDLVRNYLFMQVPLSEQQVFYDEHWRRFESLFAADGADAAIGATGFYRNYLLRGGTYLPARDTYVDFRDQNARRGIAPEAQVAELKDFLTFELWLRRPHSCADRRIRRCLRELSKLDAATAYPLVFALLSRLSAGSLTLEAFETAMADFSSFLIRRSLVAESTRAYGRWFAEAIKRITSDPVEDLRGVWSERGWPSDRDVAKRLPEFPIYRREPVKCRLILERLEESYGHKERVDPSTLSIEHVLPQTLDEGAAGTAWKSALGIDWFQTHQHWVHTLGNLTLTGYNSEMSNSAYATKRRALTASNLLLNSYFASANNWDEQRIEIRARLLVDEVCALWPNPRQLPEAESESTVAHQRRRSNFDVEELRSQCLARLTRALGMEVAREGDARYVFAEGRVRLLCIASQPYLDGQIEYYWFGVTPMQLEFLSAVAQAHVALCCGSPDRILWLPRDDFVGFVKRMNRTGEKHWHIQLWNEDGAMRLDQPKAKTRVDVSQYVLPVGGRPP